MIRSGALALAIRAYVRAGDLDGAWLRLSEAFAHVEETGERPVEAELHRLHGELLLLGRTASPARAAAATEAEQCFRRSIRAARAQHERFWELRALISLHRLGARPDTTSQLRRLYAWFREDRNGADLLDARRLLDPIT